MKDVCTRTAFIAGFMIVWRRPFAFSRKAKRMKRQRDLRDQIEAKNMENKITLASVDHADTSVFRMMINSRPCN